MYALSFFETDSRRKEVRGLFGICSCENNDPRLPKKSTESSVGFEGINGSGKTVKQGSGAGGNQKMKPWDTIPCGPVDVTLRYLQEPWLLDVLPFKSYSGKKVLEIGCGQGIDLLSFGINGAECHANETTEKHAVIASNRFIKQRIKLVLSKESATKMPWQNSEFDLVYSMGVFHHIPDSEKAFSEAFRVLKPGGVFICAVYRKWSAFFLFQKFFWEGIVHGKLYTIGYHTLLSTIERGGGINGPYVELYTKEVLEKRLKDAGFRLETLRVTWLQPSHFGPFRAILGRLAGFLEGYLGWYLVAVAKK